MCNLKLFMNNQLFPFGTEMRGHTVTAELETNRLL